MSTFNNTTTVSSSETTDISALDALLCLTACLLCLFICAGNALTIAAIWRTPGLRSLANTYVASLAVADFIVGLTLILLALFLLPPLRVNLFFRYIHLCVLMQGLNIGMTAVSALHMTLISVDRFLYIAKPYFYERAINIKVVLVSISFAWAFGLMYSLLPQVIHKPYGEEPRCDITELLPIEYLFYSNTAIYWLLVFIIFFMYARILHTAFKQRTAIQAATNFGPGGKGQTAAARSKTLKSIRFFLTVFGVFFICLTPMLICIGVDFYTNVPENLYRFFNLLALTNSGMNFIIYVILNQEFRYAFLKILHLRTLARNQESRVFTVSSMRPDY